MKQVTEFSAPHKPQLQSRAVESTFNWYWVVDGVRSQGYPIDLASPARIEQYSGIKHVDDKVDTFHLADLQPLNILPKAHVYDPELRPVRNLLLRRSSQVHQRTALLCGNRVGAEGGASVPSSGGAGMEGWGQFQGQLQACGPLLDPVHRVFSGREPPTDGA